MRFKINRAALAAHAVSADSSAYRGPLGCVHVDAKAGQLRAVASDGHRLHLVNLPADPDSPAPEFPKDGILLDPGVCKALAGKLNGHPGNLILDGDTVTLEVPDRKNPHLTAGRITLDNVPKDAKGERIEGGFPEADSVIPKDRPLLKADRPSYSEPMRVTVATLGVESAPLDVPPGACVRIGVNLEYLAEACKLLLLSADKVTAAGVLEVPISPSAPIMLKVTGEDGATAALHLIMPLRMPE